MDTKKISYIVMIYLMVQVVLYANEIRPVAIFSFEKSSYQISEPIGIKESSYSKNGSRIVQREWMTIVNGKRKEANSITTLLTDVGVGSREVFLRVKDSKGIWSDWTNHKVDIAPLKPLKVNGFKGEKSTYAIGEKIQFTYSYDNPNELIIKSQRWRYRNITTGGSRISSKPKYFNKAGTYEVSLEIQDEWGNWSKPEICIIKVNYEQIKRNGAYLFNRGKQGDLLEGYIDKDYTTFDTLEDVEIKDIPGTLIVSNSPESIDSSGIIYKDTTIGKGRLAIHHLNKAQVSKKLMIIASTSENTVVELKVRNVAIKGPQKNILKTGQTVVRDYFGGKPEKTYTIKPGVLTCIYDSSLVKGWKKDEVISGMLDFESNGSITWSIVSMDEQSTLTQIPMLRVLEKDMHIRGTFDVMEREYTVNSGNLKKPGKIVIGGDAEEWLVGKDALTGLSVTNRGNYGLPTNIKFTSTQGIGIILNARGGSYLGAIKWNDKKVFDAPNEDVLNHNKLATLIGTSKANIMTQWTYMLPNGSSAPVLFGFIPEQLWME